MTFKEAVSTVRGLRDSCLEGLGAIENSHTGLIRCGDPRQLRGSLNLDWELRTYYPNAARWDYGVAASAQTGGERIFWIEVHPASSGHVDQILSKHRWLMEWLANDGRALRDCSSRHEFHWVGTGRAFPPGTGPGMRRVAQAGIKGPTRILSIQPD